MKVEHILNRDANGLFIHTFIFHAVCPLTRWYTLGPLDFDRKYLVEVYLGPRKHAGLLLESDC